MRLYRVKLLNNDGSSHGFKYASNKRNAEKAGDAWGDILADKGESAAYHIEEIHVGQTKLGILDALNKYAGHADNG